MGKLLLLSCIAFVLLGAAKSNGQSVREVDYCALFDSYHEYEGKLISTTARITYSTVGRVDGDDSVLYSLKCNNADYFADVFFLTKRSMNFLEDLKPESHFIFEIDFVGKIVIKETLNFGHLGWTRAQIKIKKVKSSRALPAEGKSDWPDGNAAAPLTGRAERIGVDCQRFLKSLYIEPKRMRDDISPLLSDDFFFQKRDGKTRSKDEYLKADSPIITTWKGGPTEIGGSKVERTKKGVSARGSVKIDVDTPNEKKFTCLMSLTLKDGLWVISSARLK